MNALLEKPMSQKNLNWWELPAKRWVNRKSWESDSQRQKVYDAESVFGWKLEHGLEIPLKRFNDLNHVKRYVDSLTNGAWFIKRFGEWNIKIDWKKGHGADASAWRKEIRFSKSDSRSLSTILHEVAHIVHKRGAGAAHGRFYARTMIELVGHVLGNKAVKLLKDCYKRRNVKYLPHRELSDETRAKLRQSFIQNVINKKETADGL